MLKCTYIVLIQNHENNIRTLVNALQKTTGEFRKEYIFVDDGSDDNSLKILKEAAKDLPRSTIITQEMQGEAISVNKALNLANGDYIHFVEGDEIMHPESTQLLLEACLANEVGVAIGRSVTGAYKHEALEAKTAIIEQPMGEILLGKDAYLRNIGRSGSMIDRKMLENIGGADSEVYSQNMSLALNAAKYSKFVYLKENITYISDRSIGLDRQFEAFNILKSVSNFVENNKGLMTNFIPELILCLNEQAETRRSKAMYSMRHIASKYLKTPAIDKILELYQNELEKLF